MRNAIVKLEIYNKQKNEMEAFVFRFYFKKGLVYFFFFFSYFLAVSFSISCLSVTVFYFIYFIILTFIVLYFSYSRLHVTSFTLVAVVKKRDEFYVLFRWLESLWSSFRCSLEKEKLRDRVKNYINENEIEREGKVVFFPKKGVILYSRCNSL